MRPKEDALDDVSNWRPIVILLIFYKVFSRLNYNRLTPDLFTQQSFDQHGFTPDIRIEDALLCVEIILFNIQICMMPMIMIKTFGTIDHNSILQAFRYRGNFKEIHCTCTNFVFSGDRHSEWKLPIRYPTWRKARGYPQRSPLQFSSGHGFWSMATTTFRRGNLYWIRIEETNEYAIRRRCTSLRAFSSRSRAYG